MAVEATPPFQNPLERIGHTVREVPAWAGRHWKSLALTVAALGGAGYVSIQLARPYTPDTQVKTTVPVSDTFKPADPGLDSEVLIPAIPTPTETATPSPTAKPTETAIPEPTKAPPKEKPSSLTAANFNEFVGSVSPEEFQKLAKSQPDAFAFPVKPLGGDFQMTYQDIPTDIASMKGNGKAADMNGSDMLLVSAIDGEMTVRKDDPFNKDKITSIWVSRKVSEKTTLIQYIYTGNSTSVSLVGSTGPSERGNAVAQVSGKVGISIYSSERLDQPIVINRPDGGKTGILAYTTYLTPSIFENSDWINQDGKAVTSQN